MIIGMMSMLMSHKRSMPTVSAGFALPTILISSIVMLIVLLSSVSAASSISSALNDQYYNQLAKIAAESGIARANACLRSNSYNPQWNDTNKLRPDTTCAGTAISGGNRYIVSDGNMRTTFTVGLPVTGQSSSVRVVATGVTELLRSTNGSVRETYSQTLATQSSYNHKPQLASGAGWKTVGTGGYSGHNGYMVSSGGTLYAWGDNAGNQIGSDSLGITVSTPVEVVLPAGVTQVKKVYNSGQGASTLCILGSDDQLYCRGSGGLGSDVWQRFGISTSMKVIDANINGYGLDSICVITDSLEVWCAGANDRGQLGYGFSSTHANYRSFFPLSSPVQFRLDLANPGPISGDATSLGAVQVFTQDLYTCVLATDQHVYCAGLNSYGQLGQGDTFGNANGGNVTPGRALLPTTATDVKMSYHGGMDGLFYMGVNGRVYMSGHNGLGTAADGNATGTRTANYMTPRAITGSGFQSTISIGSAGVDGVHSMCALAATAGTVYCVGQNTYGQLGNTSTPCGGIQATMQQFVLPAGEYAVGLMNEEAGYQMNSVMVLTRSGKVFAAGDNTYGKLGTTHPLQACNQTPREVQMPFVGTSTTERVKAVALANNDEYTSFILGNDGRIYAMGRNNNGQIGDGTTTNRSRPVEVQIPRQAVIF